MISKTSERKQGIIALIFLSFVFASMGIFARYLSTGFLLFQQVYMRMFAALLVGLILFAKKLDFSKIKKIKAKEWWIILLRATSYSLGGIILFTQAIVITKYSNVSFISALPVTAVMGFALLGEMFTFKKLLYVTLAFIGVLLISVTDYSNIFYWGRGEVLTLISAFFFSLSYIARKWQSKLLNNYEMTVINFLFAFLVIFIISLIKGDGLPIDNWHLGLLVAVILAGTFNIVNVFLTNYGFEKVEAVLASNILTLEAFFAVVIGFLLYNWLGEL